MTDALSSEILKKKTERLREESGSIVGTDPLLNFFYLLARDELPVGSVEKILGAVEISQSRGTAKYTNGWLAEWAQNAASRVRS
jgi:hypothetical protein